MKSRNWFLISLLLLVAAALCWQQGERLRPRDQPRDGATNAAGPTVWERFTRLPYVLTGRTAPRDAAVPASPAAPELLSLSRDPRFPFRLRNSQKPEAEFFRSETAVLLRNALVETREPLELKMPAHLRAGEEPGSWLVQARGAIDQGFRDVLRGAGAEIVSYVPNNAYLVRGSAILAQQLRVSQRVQSVLPFEPYYKLDMTLLPLAVRREALPAGRWLNLVLFAGTQEKARADLRALGAEVKSEQPFPFGHVVTIAPRADSLVALAQMTAVQNIEAYHSPVLMNDLSRVRLDVSTTTTANAPAGNWLGLTGNGVFVGLIDSGIDLAHGQLTGRTFTNAYSPINDTNLVNPGHGTFIAGVIAANDAADGAAVNGSINGATYRGIAPGARVYPLSLFSTDYTNYANIWLITNAALATNIFVVNNSWGYPVFNYDINSALFDEAVRDSLAFRPHDQPMTHVFSVGNSGGANSGGTGGTADSINSPGNAKNVISVGASEQFRLVPGTTNDPLASAHSDSASQVSDISGRGNVGVGIEGPSGRFKPDLIAPGDYVVSLRASTFTSLTESDADLGSTWRYERGTSIAAGKVSGLLALMEEFFGVNYAKTNKPSLNKALLINRAHTLNTAYDFAVSSTVSHQGWGIPSLSNTLPTITAFGYVSNNAAVTRPIVIVEESGLVTNHLATGQFHAYDVQVPSAVSQTNLLKITLAWTDPAGNPVSSTKLVIDVDLYVTNIVANGAQYEGNNFAPGALVTQPTVPPTPSARDLVNNVENTYIPLTNSPPTAATTFRVYVIGRKINVNAVSANTNQVAQDYSLVISTDDPARSVTVRPTPGVAFSGYTNRATSIITNGIPRLNERVGANSPLWTVTGLGNANTNGVTNQWNFYVFTNQNYAVSTVTNVVTNIVAGVSTNTTTNVVNLPLTNGGPFVSFATFLPPNLARSRNAEADVDLFVARSGTALSVPSAFNMTNLDSAVLSHANLLRSTNRGGNELISLTNSSLGEVFYVGVKSEDQQGGTYGFFAAASLAPYSTNDTNGGVTITLIPAPIDIQDGTPEAPGGVVLYGVCTTNILMQSISNFLTYTHESLGDLVGTLTFNGTAITLNNHTITPTTNFPPPSGLQTHNLRYDDFRNPPDGPGDVTDLVGQDAIGLWIFEVYDNSPLLTGRVDYASIYIRPYTNQYSTNANVSYRTITLQAGQSFVDFLDVPVTATNLDVDVIGGLGSVPGPAATGTGIDLLAGVPGFIPTSSNYSIGTFDLDGTDSGSFPHLRIAATSVSNLVSGAAAPLGTPSLLPGRWNFRVINNSAGLVTLTVRYTLGLNLAVADSQITFTNVGVTLLDNYTTNLFMNMAADRVIAGVDVGMAILHPRISDLVIHLISPSGRKVLLFEDRGGTNGVTTANLRANFTENTNFVTHVQTTNALGLPKSTNLGRLVPIKSIAGPFSAVVSPPTLVTNMTNLLFGHTSIPLPSSPQESPSALAHQGHSLFMVGSVNRTGVANTRGTNDAFIVSYITPIVTNLYYTNLVTNFIGGVAVSTQFVNFPVTNWSITNFWSGSFSGYRGGDSTVAAASRTPEQTLFSGVAANVEGVFAVGETRNYTPPAQFTWNGNSNRSVFDVDLGSTAGSVTLTHAGGTNSVRDRVQLEYEGRLLMDFTPATVVGRATNYVTNLLFSGNSRFMRVIVNPTNSLGTNSWTNYLSVYRSSGVEYAVDDFFTYLPANRPEFRTPPLTAPLPAAPNPRTLTLPTAVALDNSNNVFVADVDGASVGRILKFSQALSIADFSSPATVTSDTNGTYVPLTLTPAVHGFPAYNTLNNPRGVAVHTNGDIYVADTGNNLIKHYRGDGTWIRTFGDVSVGPGLNNVAAGSLNAPEGISICTTTNLTNNVVLFVADTGNNSIRQIDTNGTITTIPLLPAVVATLGAFQPSALVVHQTTDFVATNFAGGTNFNSGSLFAVTSPPALPAAVTSCNALSGTNIYIADRLNNRIVWLFFTNGAWGGVNLAGSSAGASGFVNGNNTTARFNSPSGITRDGAGNLYVSDRGNNAIRKVTPFGSVTTIAGSTAGSVGTANSEYGTVARFDTPLGLAADHFGGLFVADSVNRIIRTVMPYQQQTPTNAFAVFFPFNGPTNHTMGVPPVLISRGLTNSVFNTEMFGFPSRDRYVGVTTSAETGTNGLTTNFIYAVGDAYFSGAFDLAHNTYVRPFLTKFTMTGQPLWTRGYLPPAVIGMTFDANTNITGFSPTFAGSGYATAPQAFLGSTVSGSAAVTDTSVAVTVAAGAVTGGSVPPAAMAGPFTGAAVFVAAPISSNMPATSLAVAYGTNVIAAGYSNLSTVPLTFNNKPFLMSMATTNGTQLWATNSTNSGQYDSVAVYGDKIIAVGRAYAGGNILNSSNLIEQWSLTGTQLLSLTTNFGLNRTSWLSSVVAIESLDRAYAVGSVINSDETVHAVMLEIDLQNMAVLSVVTNNITNYNNLGFKATNYGKAIATDGVDLYVAVEGPGEGNIQDRQAAVFRYRAKNFYQPEETLNTFVGERTWGTNTFYTNNAGSPTNFVVTNTAWRLQIADTRAGATNTAAQVLSWSLNFSYAASNTTALSLPTSVNNPIVLLSTTPQYFQVRVPSAASGATNLITSSAAVRVTFNPASIPTPGAPGNVVMFAGAATGSFVVTTNSDAIARLRPGSEYYIAIQAMSAGPPVNVTVRVDFDRTELAPPITSLASGSLVNGFVPRTANLAGYSFEVPANASAAMFEIVTADGDVNLYLRRSNGSVSLPTPQTFDYRSANPGSGIEQIFLITNTAAAASLTPGTWYLGVQNADNAPVAFTLRATAASATPYTVVTAANGQAQSSVTSPGNAPNTLFKLNVPSSQKALLFEVRSLTGAGDLIVRKDGFPLATANDGTNFRPGTQPEIVTVRTNASRTSLVGDWYFGVLNPGASHIGYTVMARQPTNGVLLSSGPIQILSTPGGGLITGGTSFGFDLDVVPGETYQVQYATTLVSTNWLVLTNIVAPPGGVINFLHSGALTNRNLYYRIQVVP
ncbi:MAG: proprotein convertase P-domain-containing protein [Verrucomicrobia bacterium]|nr:proprotein convertase P-domain-containing protein [Verrucomicrobiota bacterium]